MCYPQRPDHPALQDINLRFIAGQTHSLCGPSGNGKSSIMALLQRFYDPSRGTITFGGTDHRQIPLDDLRASMAYVSQDSVLFEGPFGGICLSVHSIRLPSLKTRSRWRADKHSASNEAVTGFRTNAELEQYLGLRARSHKRSGHRGRNERLEFKWWTATTAVYRARADSEPQDLVAGWCVSQGFEKK